MPHVELGLRTPFETEAPHTPARLGALRTAALVRAHAANDASSFGAEAPRDGTDGTLAAPPSDDVVDPLPVARRLLSPEVHRDATRLRSRFIGDAFVALVDAIAGLARRVRDAYLAHRRAASTRARLGELDDRMLRDLGLHRSEISSMGAEIGGQAETTRVHAMLAAHGVWR